MSTWILLSLLFPVLLGMVNILDKLITDRYSSRTNYYAFWIGIYELVLGAVIVLGVLSVQGMEPRALRGGLLTGGTRAISLLLLLAALKRGQVTRIVPLWYLYPLLVAPMAAGFLDERLSGLVWVAIFLAVLGAVLVSWQGNVGRQSFGNLPPLLLALAAGVVFATSIVLSKYFLDDEPFWQFYGSSRLGLALGMLGATFLTEVQRGSISMFRNRGFMGMVTLVEVVVSMATIVNFAAIVLGPVSLVAAISAIQPSLVLLYSLGLARLSPSSFGGWVTMRTLHIQLVGIVAITSGVVLISLFSKV